MNVSSVGSRPPPTHRLRASSIATAVEVAEFLAHLFEREPEGKKALRGVDWQTERQTLLAKRGDHPGAFVEGGFGCLGSAPVGQRVCASVQVIGCAFRYAKSSGPSRAWSASESGSAAARRT
jgi:hypothetical protein